LQSIVACNPENMLLSHPVVRLRNQISLTIYKTLTVGNFVAATGTKHGVY